MPNFNRIRIMFLPQMRAIQTADLVESFLSDEYPVILTPENGLRELDKGLPSLPKGYIDGDNLPLLTTAWDKFYDEAYHNRNLSYRFGSHKGKVKIYNELEGKFKLQCIFLGCIHEFL